MYTCVLALSAQRYEACACVSSCACPHVCMHVCMHVCVPTCMHACIYAVSGSCGPLARALGSSAPPRPSLDCIHAYMYACTHAYAYIRRLGLFNTTESLDCMHVCMHANAHMTHRRVRWDLQHHRVSRLHTRRVRGNGQRP